MHINHSLIELIGKTPLLDCTPLTGRASARLVAKLELFNPGGSIKDRPAKAMIEAAEEAGLLRKGMTIVEPTAGNTGIGLALVGNLKGYKTVFFVPDRMSKEKIVCMQLLGAEVVLVDKDLGMPGCIKQAHDYAERTGHCFIPQQFENPANPDQAEHFLGPEVHEQLGYYPDGLAVGSGTGGTFTGLARWLRNNHPTPQCWCVQPLGSVFAGDPKGSYEVEGIGNSFVPDTLDLDLADRIVTVKDAQSFKRVKEAALKLGLLLGGSSGANLDAAIELCHELGPGKTVLTVLPDGLERYLSKEWVTKLVRS
ncbi:MAG: cysteine synthase family protein [Acidobacteria bacterium]|nr:cysteine synthase family protein [Acidobacteriota bacterium]